MNMQTYVIEGEWDDTEWREVAAKGAGRTAVENALYGRGPRLHPWGSLVVFVPQDDGRVFIFPSQGHADAYAAAQAPAKPVEPEAVPDRPSEAAE